MVHMILPSPYLSSLPPCMRKRRYPGGGLNEAVQTLRTLLSSAAASQKLLPASTASSVPTLPPVPRGMTTLKSFESLSSLSDEQLESLKNEIQNSRQQIEEDLGNWEELGKQLKSALDAALLTITLKSEPGMPKRRRTLIPSEEAITEDSSGGSEESASEMDDSHAKTSKPILFSNSRADSPVIPAVASATNNEASSDENNEPQLAVGRQVAFKIPRSTMDEWIQCEITRVITPGLRFEVRDPEPDERGNPGKTYQCRLRDIILLPLPDQPPKPLPSGSVVLARYPETTAFYKAKVSTYSPKRRSYFLRFEGEEDTHKEIEVDDTLVLPTSRARR